MSPGLQFRWHQGFTRSIEQLVCSLSNGTLEPLNTYVAQLLFVSYSRYTAWFTGDCEPSLEVAKSHLGYFFTKWYISWDVRVFFLDSS